MVARLVRDAFDREGWLFELKWDGLRVIAETELIVVFGCTRADTMI
jgi:ATP-dependent DNA ligase